MPRYTVPSGDAFDVSALLETRQSDSVIAALPQGGFVIVWNGPGQDDPETFSDGIFARAYDSAGLPSGPEFLVNTTTDDNQRNPAVTAASDGSFTVFWDSFGSDGSLSGIVGRSFNADGVGGSEFDVNTTTVSQQNQPVAASLADEGIAVAWVSAFQDGSDSGIAARITGAGGGGEDDFLVNTTTENNQDTPSIAPLADGSFVVSWTSYARATAAASLTGNIHAQRISATGALLGSEILVNTDTGGTQNRSAVAALEGGGFVIVWDASDFSDRSIHAQLFDASGAKVGSEALVNTHGSPSMLMPSVTATADGGYLVSWRSGGVFTDPELPGGYYGQLYDAAGTVAGAEFLITSDVRSNPEPARLTTLADGDMIAVWSSAGSGTEIGGIDGIRLITAGEIAGTDGDDALVGAHLGDLIRGLAGNDTLEGLDGSDTLDGGGGDDFIFGGSSAQDLRDVIYGGDGNDNIDGGYGNDELRGDAGNDTIAGGFGADTAIGGTGDDVLTGSALGDILFGGGGDDFVNGGFGYDRVNGGGGADDFFHLGVFDHGSDWIQDYDHSEGDTLVFGVANATRAQFQLNIATTPTAGAAGVEEVFVIYRPTGQIMWALVDGAGQDQIFLQIGGETFDLMV